MFGIINNRNYSNMDCISQYCPSTVNRAIGKIRRKRGFYDKSTLFQFSTAHKKKPSIQNLLAHLKFQRDLGIRPTPQLLKHLLNSTEDIPRKLMRPALNLLIENRMPEEALQATDPETLRLLADKSPPIADALHKRDRAISPNAQKLATFHAKQRSNREEFLKYLNRHGDSICIVGNAATLIDSDNGNYIDNHDVVVRFNHYQSKQSDINDTGTKMNVWVCSPNVATNTKEILESAEWIVLTGCDIRYQLANWQPLIPLIESNKKIITVPIEIWQGLVERLNAPPSAGLLLLSWLIEEIDQPKKPVATGFQVDEPPTVNQRYHHALPNHKPGWRHNWEYERKLLNTWIDTELIVLDKG